MITPSFTGGHEVTQPVAVEGAEVGDGIAIHIKHIEVKSHATTSGVHDVVEDRFIDDPFVAAKCSGCGALNPPTKIVGIGQNAVICNKCGAEVSPFRISNGYTIVFDHNNAIGVTINQEAANKIAERARDMACLPAQSGQNPILTFAVADLQGVATRLRPFIGNIGTTPSIDMPDSHNAGDFGQFLVGARHKWSKKPQDLEARTDGHLDIDSVREGAIIICPVKVRGGGVYIGDVHAMQGDGEIAGHTTDVSAKVTLIVEVIKELNNEGPILLPPLEDLPYLAKPHTAEERKAMKVLGKKYRQDVVEESAAIQVVGSGADLNKATETGLTRMAKLMDMPIAEVMNRVTLTGGIEIGRLPGIVTITMLAPTKQLKKLKIAHLVKRQYRL
jgi:formamidase